MEIRYRADIDGLRTLAILPVVLFHAGVARLGGGYVGVDIFFVISGFLITGIIAREVDEGRFSIAGFYERRVRRILPALFAVTLFVLGAAAWLYFPSDFRLVGRSVIATLLFVSNVNFWAESDYFGASSQTKPMLHTWSLAVEEQFYIVFPLLLLAIARYGPRRRTAVLWLVFAGSLAFSIWQTCAHPTGAFYLPMARAWELATGALLAVGAVPAVRGRGPREALALAGVLAIAIAVFGFTERTRFPGAAALLPVLGSAALIHAAPGTLVGRALSTRLMVAIGLVSYSLYLWHWPIIVFLQYARDARLEGWWTLLAIAASFAMAILSWHVVERPFRGKGGARRVPRARLFAGAGAVAALLALASAAVYAKRGLPGRFPAPVLALANADRDVSPLRTSCHVNTARDLARAPCRLGAAVPPGAILWGDSHGVELAYALGELARAHGAALIQATASSCAPVPSLPVERVCDRHNRNTLALIARDPALGTVVLAGYWTDPANRRRPGFATALLLTAERLRALGRRVVLVEDAPPQPFDVPHRLAHLAERGALATQAGTSRAEGVRLAAYLEPTVARLRGEGVTVVTPADALCHGDACDIYRDGHPLYFDRHHLSLSGARLVARLAEPAVFGGRG